MKTEMIGIKTVENHFNTGFVLVVGGDAFWSGTCTFHDDCAVRADYPAVSGYRVYDVYTDGRDGDDVPDGLRWLGHKDMMALHPEISITFADPRD